MPSYAVIKWKKVRENERKREREREREKLAFVFVCVNVEDKEFIALPLDISRTIQSSSRV